MRYLAVVLFLGLASQAFAQFTGGTTGGGLTGGGLTGGGLSGGTSGGGLTTGGSRTGGATTGQGRSGQGGFSNSGGGQSGGFGGLGGLTGGGGLGGLTGGGGLGGTGGTSFSVSNTNLLSTTYSNPLAAGKPGTQIQGTTQAMTGTQVGQSMNIRGVGFGQASFGNVGTGGTARTGNVPGGLNSGFTTGGASGIGGTGMNRGMANTNNMNNQGGGTSRLHYTVTLVDAPAAPANAVLKADVSTIIGRSSSIKNPSGIEVVTEGQKVILRGKVSSDSERRLVEGMVRLTPGVREVVNELQAP